MLRQKYRATSDPGLTVVAGSSYGGLAAVFAGLHYPRIFGGVLSLSGSFWWKPASEQEPESVDQTGRSLAQPGAPFLFRGRTDGRLSRHQIVPNRRMRDVVTAKGSAVGYAEYDGGHSFLNWSNGTANGLVFLLGNKGAGLAPRRGRVPNFGPTRTTLSVVVPAAEYRGR